MSTPVKPIPEGFHTVTPYLTVKGAVQALEFYKRAFGARERFRMMGPNDTVAHAEMTIGDSIIMLGDESPYGQSPLALKGISISIVLYVEDVDASFQRAIDAGATETLPVQDKFYGDRSGSLTDPFGHHWHLMTHIEDVSEEEVKQRMAKMCAQPNA